MSTALKCAQWFTQMICLLLLCALMTFAQESPLIQPPPQPNAVAPTEITRGQATIAAPVAAPLSRLSAAQKLQHGAKAAFFNPGAFLGPAFGAYFTQRNELRIPAKTRADNFADGLSFYARLYARQTTAEFMSAGLYPALFRQDPRYYPSSDRRLAARLLYTSTRTLLTRSDAGRTQYNYSRLAGLLTSAALANAYERNTAKTRDAQRKIISFNQRTGSAATFRNFGLLVASDVIGNVFFNEFRLGDKLGKGVRKIFGR